MNEVWTDGNGHFYEGDMQPGDRAATDAEVAAWRASLVDLPTVQAECARRINLIVSDDQKLSMLGGMVAQIASVSLLGQAVTPAEQTAGTLFIQSMQWIGAMKGACAALVGNVDYQQDANWPVLPNGLAAFAATF